MRIGDSPDRIGRALGDGDAPGGGRPRRDELRARSAAGEPHEDEMSRSTVFSGAFVQRDGPGGAVRGGGGGIVIGSILRPRRAVAGSRSGGPCTPVFLSRWAAVEEPSPTSERSLRVGTDWFEGPRSWRGPRVEEAGTRNDRGPSHCHPVGPGRSRREPRSDARSPGETKIPGSTWRKPPRQQSVKPRNSSGSLTS